MNGTIRLVMCCVITGCVSAALAAQSSSRGTRPPLVTAESESWYLEGTPITFAGQTYHLAGSKVHFIPTEMVRSGDFLGVPLYARTTIEPYSMVFVPVAGGLMQPYERRRAGDIAGTVGSTASSFPVALSSDESSGYATFGHQAPAPPRHADPAFDAALFNGPEPVGTTGIGAAAPLAAPPPLVDLAVQARRRRAESPNAIYFQYDGARWFSSGSAVPFDASRFVRTGEKDGFPIYRTRRGPAATIYVPVAKDAAGALAPYTRRDP
jgi:hypothetical protein